MYLGLIAAIFVKCVSPGETEVAAELVNSAKRSDARGVRTLEEMFNRLKGGGRIQGGPTD